MRSINSDDIASSEPLMIMTLAKTFNKKDKPWDELSDITKKRYIEQAIKSLKVILNNTEVMQKMVNSYYDRM